MNSDGTLRRIQTRLGQSAAPWQVVEQFLPRTRAEAVAWARWMAAWDEFRGQYPDQVIGLARVVSRRAMRAFGLSLSGDGRVVSAFRDGRPWQTPAPSLTFRLAIGPEDLRVEYTPDYFPGGGQDHFCFVSPHEPARSHCLSSSGYLSKLAPHDAVEAAGGTRAYAALYAEARLAGREQEFDAAFEGAWPEAKQPRRRKKPSPPAAPSAPAEKSAGVLGPHTAQVIEEQAATKDLGGTPRQRLLF